MLRGAINVEISRALIIVWLLPAVGMLVALIAVRAARPARHARVLTVLRTLLLAYLCGAVLLTLYPYDLDPSVAQVENGNWTPFGGTIGFFLSENPLRHAVAVRDVVANVVLFAPFGLLLPYAFDQWRGIGVPALIIAFLAFGLEFVQGLSVADRTFDIDDAIAGFGGGVAALLVAAILRPAAHRSA